MQTEYDRDFDIKGKRKFPRGRAIVVHDIKRMDYNTSLRGKASFQYMKACTQALFPMCQARDEQTARNLFGILFFVTFSAIIYRVFRKWLSIYNPLSCL